MTNTLRRRLRAATRRVRGTRDAGTTLIEVLVSTTIMSIVMAAATAGILQMYRSSTRSEAVQTAQSQLHAMFIKLDRDIRYASYISTPAKVNNTFYVEYKKTNGYCYELALTTTTATVGGTSFPAKSLVWLWWPEGSPLATAPTTMLLATTADTVQAGGPFIQVDGTHFEGLRIQIKDTTASSAATDMTFTALNSADALTDNPALTGRSGCTERRS